MKVLQINHFSYKAAGAIMMSLHNALLENGIDSYVAWGRGRKPRNDHEYYMNDELGVKLHGVYTRITDKTGFASTKATKQFIRWIDGIKPDIIHLHCIHGYYLNIELLFNYIKEHHIKVIWTQHDCWAFTGHCAYFDAVGCEKWKTECHNCPQSDTYPASIIMDNSKWNWYKKKELFSGINMTIVTPCNWLSLLVHQSFLGSYPTRVIYNGVDTSIFKPRKTNFLKNNKLEKYKIILGVASEWTERKGLKDFILLDNMINKDEYRIVVVGVTDKQKADLPKDLVALNRTNDIKELVDIYSSSYVLFNPTYEDNFPTVNLEAISCGTPVITYKTGGSVEPIEKNGFVVDKGDLKKTYEHLQDIEFLDNISLNSQFSKEVMFKNYIDLYARLYNEN